jgi:hypothetical protein
MLVADLQHWDTHSMLKVGGVSGAVGMCVGFMAAIYTKSSGSGRNCD